MFILCTESVDIVRKHVVLDMGVYNLVADMRWRLYGVEVTVSTSLLPYSSSENQHHHHPHQLNHHDLVRNEFYDTYYIRHTF